MFTKMLYGQKSTAASIFNYPHILYRLKKTYYNTTKKINKSEFEFPAILLFQVILGKQEEPRRLRRGA